MAEDFVGPWCEKYLDQYMVGQHGFNGVVNNPDYLRFARCLRKAIKRRDLPLAVMGTHGHVLVYIDEAKLTQEERARYDQANLALLESIGTGKPARAVWPLDR
jgi:hypothetical protein